MSTVRRVREVLARHRRHRQWKREHGWKPWDPEDTEWPPGTGHPADDPDWPHNWPDGTKDLREDSEPSEPTLIDPETGERYEVSTGDEEAPL